MASPILASFPLGPQWPTIDPFLFVAHHDDAYPAATASLGPDPGELAGRPIGNDFSARDGWSMYHGSEVPGFPEHPHRGFETITYVRQGFVDHSDSLGATARYGRGDTQWMTAGAGIVHAEMFPLLDSEGPNPLELFQIWLNLPAADKLVPPYFTMLWNRNIPVHDVPDSAGRSTRVTVIAGKLGEAQPPSPPPDSWASHDDGDVAIWHVVADPGASWTLPAVDERTQRVLYAFSGSGFSLDGHAIGPKTGAHITADRDLVLQAGPEGAECMILQGRPIGERVVQHGPFVMNDEAEIRQAFTDFQNTGFGGWPWPSPDHAHVMSEDRFAKHADGTLEHPVG